MIGAFFVFTLPTQGTALNDVVINEIAWMGTETSSADEWIELYNNTNEDINLSGWGLYETGGETLIEPLIGIINAKSYYLVERTNDYTLPDIEASQPPTSWSGYGLGDNGEHLQLLDNNSNIIDEVNNANEWFTGDKTTKQTMERKNPLNPGNSTDNWQASAEAGGTPKGQNSDGAKAPIEEETQTQEESSSSSSSPSSSSASDASSSSTTNTSSTPTGANHKNVKITEIFPNPETNQNSAEFIEIWNNNNASITLDGWKLSDLSKVITLGAITLVPGEYKAIYRTETKIALNNSSEKIYLYDNNGNLIDEISYNSTIKGYSLSYNIKQNEFLWSSTKTPSKMNEFTMPNEPPEAIITFSHNPVAPTEVFTVFATNSTDPDNDALSYFWEIGEKFQASGEQFKYSFDALGEYLIKLTVSDKYHNIVATTTISVMPAVDVVSLRSQSDIKSDKATGSDPAAITSGQIFITEIFPNPAGADNDEWIKLYNPNNFNIILDNWIIDDQEGGSKPHTIVDRSIGAKEYLTLGKEETKIMLNNTSDEVRLFDIKEKLIDSVLYDDVKEEQTYLKTDEDTWVWSGEVQAESVDYSITDYATAGYEAINIYNATNQDIVDIDLPDIRELELGTEVRVQGTVAVEPGVLGKTYFYITGSPGIQVYFYKKDWPQMQVGDMVGVIGELTESNNETRLKVASKEDIVSLYESDPPEPMDMQTGDISENIEGALIALAGELVEKKGTSWFIDDGTGEAKITFQPTANITKPTAKSGDWIRVVGLVSETQSGYRVLPRYQSDIGLIDPEEILAQDAGQVLGASADNMQSDADGIQRFRIPENNQPNKIFIYLLITSGALIILLISLIIKFRMETKKRSKSA